MMVVLNFFIATMHTQLLSRPAAAPSLTFAFGAMLPAGGVIFIPVIGLILDNFGTDWGYVTLWWACTFYFGFWSLYQSSGIEVFAYLAFGFFAFCRPLFYTLGATFCGRLFGFETFGRLYGLLVTISGVMNTCLRPLTELAWKTNFEFSMHILWVFQLSTIVFPLYMLTKVQCAKRSGALNVDMMHRTLSNGYFRSPAMTPSPGRRRKVSGLTDGSASPGRRRKGSYMGSEQSSAQA